MGNGLSSASYSMGGGFGEAYPPPGEVANLAFLSDDQTLEWDPEKSAGIYNLYRDLLSGLSGDPGQCHESSIASATTTDTDVPVSAGDGFFYLVTVENRLGEEGTKGFDSGAGERGNSSPCP